MTAADRLREAATKIRVPAQALADAMARGAVLPAGVAVAMEEAFTATGFTSPPVALAVADLLDDVAADKDSGLTTIHPRLLNLADLILGDAP